MHSQNLLTKRAFSLSFCTLLFLFINLITGCSLFKKTHLSDDSRLTERGLSEKEAALRSENISGVSYHLAVSLDETSSEFTGRQRIEFTLNQANRDLTIDFSGGKILSIEYDQRHLSWSEYDENDFFIVIPQKILSTGTHAIQIEFSHPYSNSGTGLHRFQDPEDNRTYLYTQFEAYDANQMFPCFDQPNLKATFTLEVVAPPQWQVISATRESSVKKISSTQTKWEFPKSPLMSTYVFSLHAGPYTQWKDQWHRQGMKPISLRLFSRKSLARYINPTEWFQTTKQGLRFFSKYFDVAYPFYKYDQVIAPDFNAGAMENVAAVTFSERFVIRSQKTRSQRLSLAETILHEMAHMWFGNLVTMNWWNGLWLNESFATYLSHLALEKSTEFHESWLSFFLRNKQGAYVEDELSTTHPVDVPVRDTEAAFVNFDSITYGKGASLLKQLAFLVGEEGFQKGVRAYLKRHAYRNARLEDFIGAIARENQIDLTLWSKTWLQGTGTNTISTKLQCSPKGGEENLDHESFIFLNQTPPYRSHATEVALFSLQPDGSLKSFGTKAVRYRGKETRISISRLLHDKQCPDLIYPNYGDHDYVRVALDSRSLATATAHLSQFSDPLLRAMLWESFWDGVWSAQLPITLYVDLVLKHLGQETDTTIVTHVLRHVPYIYQFLPLGSEPNSNQGNVAAKRLSDFLWEQFRKSPAGSDLQKTWFDAFLKATPEPWMIQTIQKILIGKVKLEKFPIDQDRRWEMITRVATQTSKATLDGLLKTALLSDRSDYASKMALFARATIADLENKKFWLSKIKENLRITHETSSVSLSQLRYAMEGLFPRNQKYFISSLREELFQLIEFASKNSDNEMAASIARSLSPRDCSIASTEALRDFIETHKSDFPPSVLKPLQNGLEFDRKCIAIRAKAFGL